MPCDVPVRTCGDTCDKALSCGHACQERCHEGPCPPCRQMINKECECGKARKLAMCSTEYRCERLCPLMRNCQRHPCKKRVRHAYRAASRLFWLPGVKEPAIQPTPSFF
jgi:hypothetical protein